MRLTKKEALKRCAEMWDDLAESGSGHKAEAFKRLWPEYRPTDINECWACEYDDGSHDGPCSDVCIMKSVWPKGCCHEDSPYNKWEFAETSEDRREWAKEIADGARDCLAKLEKKG